MNRRFIIWISVAAIAAPIWPMNWTRMRIVGQIGAVTLLRKNKPASEFPFRNWLYPIPSLIALVGWLFLFVTACFDADKSQIHLRTQFTALILGTLVVGLIAFLIWSWRSRTWPFANPSLHSSASLS